MGLSAGDVSWEDGDYHGLPVVEAARLEAEAEGGEILCSDLVRVLARGRGGHRFEEVGFLELKGLAEPLAACRVVWEAPEVAGEAAVSLPLPSALRSLADDPVFVGREGALAAVEAALGGVSAPNGPAAGDPPRAPGLRAAWIVGEPGAGKTRLAAEVAARFHAAGGLVLFGRCDADVPAPYRPFVEILGQLLSRLPAKAAVELFGRHAAELVRLLPRLAELVGVAPPDAGRDLVVGAEIGRWRLLEAIRGLLVDVAARVPTLVVLDDLHWATESTVHTLRHLARSDEPPALAFLATLRNTEPNDAVLDALAELSLASARGGVALGGLDTAAVAELVRGVGHMVNLRGISELVASTAGNPLFLRATLRSEDSGTSLDLRGVVRRRLGRLAPPVVEALRVAAVAGLEADCAVVAGALGVPLGEVVGALDQARDAGLVEEVAAPGLGRARHRFVHALVRDALHDELSETARGLWHLRIAEALDASAPMGAAAPLAERAHHWQAGLRGGADPSHVASVLTEAGAEAEQQHDWDRASRHFLTALDLLGGVGAGGTTVRDLAHRGARALRWTGVDLDRTLDLLAAVAEQAWSEGDDDEAARAVLEFSHAHLHSHLPAIRALSLTERARQRPPSSLRGQLLVDVYHMVHLARTGQLVAASELYTSTIERARASRDRIVIATALGLVHQPSPSPSGWAGHLDELIEGFEMAMADGDLLHSTDNVMALTGAAIAAGRLDEGWRRLQTILGHPEMRAVPGQLYIARACEVAFHVAWGDFELAERTAEAVLASGRPVAGVDAIGVYGVQMFAIRWEQGAIPPLLSVMRRVLAGSTPVWRTAVAALGVAGGDPDMCQGQLDHFLRSGRLQLAPDVTRAVSVAFLAEAAVVAGDRRAAALLHAELAPEAGSFLIMFPAAFGPANRVLGLASCTAGEVERGIRELEAAVADTVRAGTPVYEARCRADLAAQLVARGGPGDAA
ncbi:MAG: AAA family ATPase, partial [Acidimicrobiia bacterium]|nr:AAA family ATPase [Acidimicrobiia bacterium]